MRHALFALTLLSLPVAAPLAATDPAPTAQAESVTPVESKIEPGTTLGADSAELLGLLRAEQLSGRFREEKTVAGFPKPMISTGTFRFAGSELRWATESPFASEIRVSPAGIEIISGETRRILSAEDIPAVGRFARMLADFLSGRLDAVREAFELSSERTADGRIAVTALPRSKALGGTIREVRLYGRTHVEEVVMTAASGEVSRMRFTDVSDSDSSVSSSADAPAPRE